MDACTDAIVRLTLPCGRIVIFNEQDAKLLVGFRWRSFKNDHNRTWYSRARIGGKIVRMHRLIIGAPDGLLVDHRDGNGLNNRRSNLRLATTAQNTRNSCGRGGASGFKGVYRACNGSPSWVGSIKADGKRIHLGSFPTEAEAARAYDAAALRLFGEFARLNFPQEASP